MNFDDTPQEAEFRATARKWIEANAPKKYEAELSKSSLGRIRLEKERQGRLFSDLYALRGPVTLDGVVSRDVQIFVGSMIRRTALDQVGGFDGELRAVEDLDLWIRLLSAGWRAEIVPEPLARYRRRPGCRMLAGDG